MNSMENGTTQLNRTKPALYSAADSYARACTRTRHAASLHDRFPSLSDSEGQISLHSVSRQREIPATLSPGPFLGAGRVRRYRRLQ